MLDDGSEYRRPDRKNSSSSPDQLAEVEAFIASLQLGERDAVLGCASAAISEPAFAAIWNNPEDDAYDAL